ncbi:acetyl-CoA hydrolase/transferase family protein [Noviherbaspirillum cavernae]|uniref:Acetyl-CoA hydrolase/transferase family protein n=1 Tax=Noviherbaspirillum cavernae TaxID=2320862 RepID=A0A418WW79_9BURK|nr:acetyl-CoA hydrolase/transferase family protein [Noviherbaspirillum cavernae]RJF96982.1 acetyl-CoA hydrolase/transferase family protein [Noviherbaspirillum cavernae]
MYQDRIRHAGLMSKVMPAQEAAQLFRNGMTVGMSGFTRAGDAKAMPAALAERAGHEPLRLTLITGASLGNGSDGLMAEAGLLARRLPFQSDATLRGKINAGEVMFIDQHLSETAEHLRSHSIAPVDIAVIEATAIAEDGSIVPTMSVGNSVTFVQQARQVIVEINLSTPLALEGLHDIYTPADRPLRAPIPLVGPQQRIGTTTIAIDPARIAAIVITDSPDSPSTNLPPDAETGAIAGHVIAFFESEVKAGRMSAELLPLQAGIGTIANAVLHGLIGSPFSNMTMFSEVLQDSAIALLDSGQLAFASASSITLSSAMHDKFMRDIEHYRSKIVLRPQEISNHPEIVRRLGIIALNTALEFDLYGNVNSTHVGGTRMMNGIGGSGDFARNGHLSMFISKSVAKNGGISSVVPMVTHVDHTEHDVDILVTEWGLADLRGLAPRERAPLIIERCAHPDYRPQLRAYFEEACRGGGHTPHVLEKALSWHVRYQSSQTMLAS